MMEYLMYSRLEEDRARLPALLAGACAYAQHVCGAMESARVAAKPRQLVLGELSAEGIGAEAALQLFGNAVAPSLNASAGPRHLGFVTGGATPAAVMGDWLATVYDQNPVSKLDGWAALQVERHTVAMLRSLFGLPSEFEGTHDNPFGDTTLECDQGALHARAGTQDVGRGAASARPRGDGHEGA